MQKSSLVETLFEALEDDYTLYDFDDSLLKCPTWDSLGILQVVSTFKLKFNVKVDSKINNFKTFRELILYLSNITKDKNV